MSEAELRKALSTEPGSGGDFIPQRMADTYFEYIRLQARGRQLFTVVPMPSDEYEYPVLAGGFNVYHIKEGQRAFFSDLATDKVKLKAKKFMVATAINDEAMENATTDWDGIIRNQFAKAHGEGEDLAMMQGDINHKATADTPKEATEDDWFKLDARLSYDGMLKMAQQDPAPDPIDLAGENLNIDVYTEIACSLGKYVQDPSMVVTLMNPVTVFRQLWKLSEFIKASEYGTVQTLWTGEVGTIYGIRQLLWGAIPLHKSLTIPIYNLFVGDTKRYKFEKDRDIFSEQTGVKSSMRACIGVPYPDAMVLVDNIGT